MKDIQPQKNVVGFIRYRESVNAHGLKVHIIDIMCGCLFFRNLDHFGREVNAVDMLDKGSMREGRLSCAAPKVKDC
jgi:hypothetical protein